MRKAVPVIRVYLDKPNLPGDAERTPLQDKK